MELRNFAIVLACSVCIAGAVGALYANGIRLLSIAQQDAEGIHHMKTRILASVSFAVCVAIVLFALWLIIPIFH